MLRYANRDSEFSQVEHLLSNNISPIIIDAAPASGVTSFIKERVEVELSDDPNNVFFYIDAKSRADFSSALLRELLLHGYGDELQKYADCKYGKRDRSILSSAVSCIPTIGSGLADLTNGRKAFPVYMGAFDSVIDEILLPFFIDMSNRKSTFPLFRDDNRKFYVAIDGVEALEEAAFSVIECLASQGKVEFIFIGNSSKIEFTKFFNQTTFMEIDETHIVKFPKPEIQLVDAMVKVNKIDASNDMIKSILDCSKENIHLIVKQIKSLSSESRIDLRLSEWEKAILLILYIIKIPLRKKSIIEIIELTELFSTDLRKSLDEALNALERRGLIRIAADEYSIASWNNSYIEPIASNFVDLNYYKDKVYNYLALNNLIPGARYSLSKELHQTTKSDARALLIHHMSLGRDVPKPLIQEAFFNKDNTIDCIISSIIHCRKRDYKTALIWLDSISDPHMRDMLLSYKAVLLNRLKRVKESEVLIKKCLAKATGADESVLLFTFLLSAYIHQEKLMEAQSCYNKISTNYVGSRRFGYLARNAVSAFSEERNDLYDLALESFRTNGDDFGYYTTLSNKGYSLCKNGEPLLGLETLCKAKEGLERFPAANLYAVHNDIGIANLLLGRWEEAFKYLSSAIDYSVDSMPFIFSSINLACLEAVVGNSKAAIKRLEGIEKDVEEHELDRVRQQYYINRLLVEHLSGKMDLDEGIIHAKKYPDRYHPEKTRSVLSYYSNYASGSSIDIATNWRDLFFPCGLVYWYVDPLYLIPECIMQEILPPHT